jgi:hypothetical protein
MYMKNQRFFLVLAIWLLVFVGIEQAIRSVENSEIAGQLVVLIGTAVAVVILLTRTASISWPMALATFLLALSIALPAFNLPPITLMPAELAAVSFGALGVNGFLYRSQHVEFSDDVILLIFSGFPAIIACTTFLPGLMPFAVIFVVAQVFLAFICDGTLTRNLLEKPRGSHA